MGEQKLYFIAIVLPLELAEQVIDVQQDLANRFQSRKALNVLPHITLIAPFTLSSADHTNLMEWFSSLIVHISPFAITLNGFDSFQNPRHPVIYIKPTPNPALLALQKILVDQFHTTFSHPIPANSEIRFKPHITVAYRDLLPEVFKVAWPEYREKQFSGSFSVTGFQLLQHDRKKWHVIGSCYLNETE
jgi:2'-5' RNA ligase